MTYTTQLLLLKQKKKNLQYIIVVKSSHVCAQPAPI